MQYSLRSLFYSTNSPFTIMASANDTTKNSGIPSSILIIYSPLSSFQNCRDPFSIIMMQSAKKIGVFMNDATQTKSSLCK